MPMQVTKDLLIEIGTEELPPKSLLKLSESFIEHLQSGLFNADLKFQEIKPYATPRRLAAIITSLEVQQPEKQLQRKGPALAAAFNAQGQATPAALGFAKSCGTTIDKLERFKTDAGEWLVFNSIEPGKPTEYLIAEVVKQALAKLPIPKRMRWGEHTAEFVRPVHWVIVLFGNDVIPCEILGAQSSRSTRGHRFHHPREINLESPGDYLQRLEQEGKVIADFNSRRAIIRHQVTGLAKQSRGTAVIDEPLLDEVTAMVEWPSAIMGSFDEKFLSIPKELLIATMKDHQRYFHVVDQDNKLLPLFITVANIESYLPETVRQGNERVIKPRLTDAAFFWEQDRKIPLADRRSTLQEIIFQKQLGSLFDKTERLSRLSLVIAQSLSIESRYVTRAAELCKCDLTSLLVGEFPELQGTMGSYYATHDGEPAEVCRAIEEHYLPRFAGDKLPNTLAGKILALADRLDTLVGVFGIGQPPTGDKDPFALRRAALGSLRILIEGELDVDLEQTLHAAVSNYPEFQPDLAGNVFDFMLDRLRAYYLDSGIQPDVFEAVLARQPTYPLDFNARIKAVTAFRQLPEAQSLAAANKRINNILRQADFSHSIAIDKTLLKEPTELALAEAMDQLNEQLQPNIAARDYRGTLMMLARLRESIDAFFDQVMVNCEDLDIRNNRLALLKCLNNLFLEVADIAKLQA